MEIITLQTIVNKIVSQQQFLIGPFAVEQANAITGLSADYSGKVRIDAKITDFKSLLNDLVIKYQELFGQTSVEVCKDAVREAGVNINDSELPDILK